MVDIDFRSMKKNTVEVIGIFGWTVALSSILSYIWLKISNKINLIERQNLYFF